MGSAYYEAFYREAGKAVGLNITKHLIINDKLKICTFAFQDK
jgi:hypothetical protein